MPIAALDRGGGRCSMTLDGAVNRLALEVSIDQVLAPTPRPGAAAIGDDTPG